MQNLRALERTQRELERERRKLEQQEKRLVAEVRANAKKGQIGATKVKAKDLVRTRNHIRKFEHMRTQIQAISLRVQSVKSTDQMARSMKDATGLLAGMNRGLNLPQLQRIAMEFEKQSDLMEQRQEFMDEAVDDVLDDTLEEDEDADEIVAKVLDEIGVDLNTQLHAVPASNSKTEVTETIPLAKEALVEGGNVDDELEARLQSLKKQ